MAAFAIESFGSPEKYVLLSDGAFDQARGAGMAEISLDLTVLKGAVDELDVRPSHLPTLAVVELATDGSYNYPQYRGELKDADPPTLVAGASLWEDAPPIFSRIGDLARQLRCQTLSFITVGSLLDPTDHYTALLKGLAAMQHAETLRRQEERFRREYVLPEQVRVAPIYKPQGAFRRHAKEVIQASKKPNTQNPSPFVITYR